MADQKINTKENSTEMGKHLYQWPRLHTVHLWLAVLLCVALVAEASARQVVLVLSEPSTPYLEAAAAIRSGLEESNAKIAVRTLGVDEVQSSGFGADTVLVPLGVRATAAVARSPGAAPVLAGLLPRQRYEKILREMVPRARQRQFSAVYLDQPYPRQFQLLNAALPDVTRVGVLLGAATQAERDTLAEAAEDSHLRLVAQVLDNAAALFPDLEALLTRCDALLLLPDVEVVNRASLQSLILTSYRQRRPVLGYSAALVGAGALLAVYSTPAQIGRQIAELIRRKPFVLPPPQAPRYFSVRVNRSVARALSLTIPADAQLYAALQAEPQP